MGIANMPTGYRRRAQRVVVRARGSLRARIIARDGLTCGICGEQILDQSELEIDHITPVCRGGRNADENLQVAHSRCNRIKGSM